MTPCSRSSTPSSTSATARRRGAAGQRGPGHRRPAVPVAVGLDHRAELGRRGQAGQHRRVVRHGGQVDLGPRRARAALGHRHRARPSSAGTGATSRTGAPSATRPPSPAARVRARTAAPPPGPGRSPATRPSRRPERRGPPVHVGGQRRRLERRQPAGAEGADDAREHVAAPGRGQRRPAGRRQQHVGGGAASGAATAVSDPFSRTTAPVARASARAAARRSVPGRGAVDAGVLAVVRREDARGAPLLEQRARRRRAARARVSASASITSGTGTAAMTALISSAAASPVPSPGPITTALHLAVASRNAPAQPSAGRCMRTASVGQAARRGRPASRAGSCRRRRPWRPGCRGWPRPPCPASRPPRRPRSSTC